MKTLLLSMLFAFSVVPATATTISFAVDSNQTGILYSGFDPQADVYEVPKFHSSGLNGTVLNGQPLSVDAVFGNGVLSRLFALYPNQFGIGLMLFTSAHGITAFPGSTTGRLLDADGKPIGAMQTAGRVMSDDGSVAVCLVTFRQSDFAWQVFDVSGAHFDMILPDSGLVVTDAMLFVNLYGNRTMFGTAAQLPELPALFLLPIGLIGIAAAGLKGGIQ